MENTKGFVQSLQQGQTIHTAPYIAGVGGVFADMIFNENHDYKKSFETEKNNYKNDYELYKKQHPKMAITGEVLGSLPLLALTATRFIPQKEYIDIVSEAYKRVLTEEQKKAMRQEARNFYRQNFQGKPIKKEGFDTDIDFTKKGIDETISSSANATKLDAIPYLKELIEAGKVTKLKGLYKKRNDDFVGFRKIKTPIKINNERNDSIITVGKTYDKNTKKTGNKFYGIDIERPLLYKIYDTFITNKNTPVSQALNKSKSTYKGNDSLIHKKQNVNKKIENIEGKNE